MGGGVLIFTGEFPTNGSTLLRAKKMKFIELEWGMTYIVKDRTRRGGKRVDAGRKSRSFIEKVHAGLEATNIDLPISTACAREEMSSMQEHLMWEKISKAPYENAPIFRRLPESMDRIQMRGSPISSISEDLELLFQMRGIDGNGKKHHVPFFSIE